MQRTKGNVKKECQCLVSNLAEAKKIYKSLTLKCNNKKNNKVEEVLILAEHRQRQTELESMHRSTLFNFLAAKKNIEEAREEVEDYSKKRSKIMGLILRDNVTRFFFKNFKFKQSFNGIHGILNNEGNWLFDSTEHAEDAALEFGDLFSHLN